LGWFADDLLTSGEVLGKMNAHRTGILRETDTIKMHERPTSKAGATASIAF
jgi:hypothetical protein